MSNRQHSLDLRDFPHDYFVSLVSGHLKNVGPSRGFSFERTYSFLKKDVYMEEALNVLSDLTMNSLGNGLSALKD